MNAIAKYKNNAKYNRVDIYYADEVGRDEFGANCWWINIADCRIKKNQFNILRSCGHVEFVSVFGLIGHERTPEYQASKPCYDCLKTALRIAYEATKSEKQIALA